jgi:hypothetical protein
MFQTDRRKVLLCMIDSNSRAEDVPKMGADATDLNLDSHERTAVLALEARLSQHVGFPISIKKLLSNWTTFIAEVERGYDSIIDEYVNDVSTRDTLEEVLRSLPEGIHAKVESALSSVDRRFEQATCPDRTRELARFTEPGTGWWERMPLKLVGPLASALKRS